MEYLVVIIIIVLFILVLLYLSRNNVSNYRANNNGTIGLDDNTYNTLHHRNKYYSDFITEYNHHPSKYTKLAVEDALHDCFNNHPRKARINLLEYENEYNTVYDRCIIDKRNNYVKPMNIINRDDYEHNRMYNSYHENHNKHENNNKHLMYNHHK